MSLTGHLSPAFFAAVEDMAATFRARGADVTAEDFLNVWLGESGVGRARQGHGGLPYYGLNMMHRNNLAGVGWRGSEEEYKYLPFEDQVPYVQRFYEGNVQAFLGGDWSRLNNATALYLMNFLPRYTSHADEPDYVLTSADDGTGWFQANPPFHHDGKDFIEVRDLTRYLDDARARDSAYWNELVTRQQTEGGSTYRRGGMGALPWLLLLGAGAFVGYRYMQVRGAPSWMPKALRPA